MRLCIESEQTTETTTKITTETNTEASTVQKTKSPKETSYNTPESGIRKEISEFLDSYEDFMNEYADFMKKYEKADSNDQTKMLADYLDYCDKYADFTQKYEDLCKNYAFQKIVSGKYLILISENCSSISFFALSS